MKTVVLLAHVETRGASSDAETTLFVHWDGWEAPPGHVSLPARLARETPIIRAEHAAWAFDLGHLEVDGREVREWLKCGDELSMWWCSLLYERHPKMTPHLFTIYRLRALERLLDEEGATALQLVGGDALMAGTLREMCRLSGRMFDWAGGASEPKPQGGRLRRLYMACPHTLRAILRYVHWWWSIRRVLPGAQSLPSAGGEKAATIATYFPNVDMTAAAQGSFRSRYWERLHDAIDAQSAVEGRPFVRWLFIRFPAPQLTFAQCRRLRDHFRQRGKDGLSFHYLEEFLRHGDLWTAFFRFLRLRKAGLRLENNIRRHFCFADSRLNFWGYAANDWAESFRGWRCLERCLQQRALQNYVRAAGPQRWTLFPLENCPWERMLTHAVHTSGHGPVIGAQHSVIRPADFRYFDDKRTFSAPECAAFQPDIICGNGASACRQWNAAGVPESRLHQVEALRYLYLAGTERKGNVHQGTRQLLVLTSFFNDEVHAHLVLLARAMRTGILDGWRVTVKPHPYLPVKELLRCLLGTQAETIRQTDEPLGQIFSPGVTVWTSNSTTAALDAALEGLPVMVMRPVGDFDLCPLQDVSDLLRTGTLEDVRHGLLSAKSLDLPRDYLNLDPALSAWRALLGFTAPTPS